MSTTKKRSKLRRPGKSPLNLAAGRFVDHLGAAAITKLKDKLGLNTETHNFQDAIAPTPGTTLAVAVSPPVIAQSLYNDGRVGDTIRVTRLSHHVRLLNNSTTACVLQFRIVVIKRDSYSFVAAAPGDVFTTASSFISQHNVNAADLGITFLHDKVYSLGSYGAGGAGMLFFDLNFDLSDFHMSWDASDATGANNQLAGNSVEILVMYSALGTVTGAPTMSVGRMVEFVDN
jgi:hypothetical protein